MVLLTKNSLSHLLKSAKTNLERDMQLAPVLFSRVSTSNKIILTPLSFDTVIHDEKTAMLAALGDALRKHTGGKILEAVIISDTFYLEPADDDATLPVRHNPARKEAIMLSGRDITGRKRVLTLQPYSRINNKIIFETPSVISSGTSYGLIDCVFSKEEGLLADRINDLDGKYDEN